MYTLCNSRHHSHLVHHKWHIYPGKSHSYIRRKSSPKYMVGRTSRIWRIGRHISHKDVRWPLRAVCDRRSNPDDAWPFTMIWSTYWGWIWISIQCLEIWIWDLWYFISFKLNKSYPFAREFSYARVSSALGQCEFSPPSVLLPCDRVYTITSVIWLFLSRSM